ncbi:ntrc family transcriptional regulator, atpase domain containing protein [Lactobacillus selangorensis]|uniref:Ntrc family transcriptional regulator, atpase domain containing protein n=1 Tax=Lactobacillus selangorensis TaxID=81857 RepID=A0A0R2FX59_9LACO|nr:PRD domain-containing protein [Lactobacillus selangorensis]KRN28806.1 ntrc family transcriptional regulator, atpase domain containing protein [Lactobacillus selangorensis]KRN32784.1 ntrc family transcriptional regulator, atpase domain containing protein [Lactobacillus selangorensis]
MPDFSQRPIDERIALLHHLFLLEAKQTGKTLTVDSAVITALTQVKHAGNIGYLKNIIQVGCATANENQPHTNHLQLDLTSFDLPVISTKRVYGDLEVAPTDSLLLTLNTPFQKPFAELRRQLNKNAADPSARHIREWKNQLQILNSDLPASNPSDGLLFQHNHLYEHIICRQFGLRERVKRFENLLYTLYRHHFTLSETSLPELTQQLKLRMPRAWHVAQQFYWELPVLDTMSQQTLTALLTILLDDSVDKKIQLRGLMVAHGENTATSIQAVVNSLCGTYIFDAIDMPIENGVKSIIDEMTRLIDDSDTTKGFILMVDMGSLSQLYTAIKSHLNGDLLVVNNLTTITALDLSLQMQQRRPFKEIAEKADHDYTISVQYYEGFSQTTNILISCISGSQVSEKMRELMQPFMPNDIKIISLDYTALKEKLVAKEWTYFDQTLFVMTTMDLDASVPFNHLNIYDLLDASGTQQFNAWLTPYLSKTQLQQLNAEFLRFMSLEGISERLRFLNPDIVIKEVEDVILKYENYYHLHLDGKVKLNLYMHVALMIERLMVRRPIDSEITTTDAQENEFIRVSKSIFQPIMLKYNIQITDYELSLMYELFKQFITV